VFGEVVLPKLARRLLKTPEDQVPTYETSVMVVPHPCQCYYGDKLRPFLTVAPVKVVESYENFGEDRSGAKDKFALPDLPVQQSDGSWTEQSCVADFGRLISIPSNWLSPPKRICCLTHRGLGLLAKRVLGFQLRDRSTTLPSAMAYVQAEWNESFLMQAWVRKHQKLSGYSDWLRNPQIIKSIDAESPIIPRDYRDGAHDALLEAITGEAVA
jgi:hypothetical protein